MKDLEELLAAILEEIRARNTVPGPKSIPESVEFVDELAKRYGLVPFGIPKLLNILCEAHKIFSFTIVEADRKEKIRRIEGYVVAEGNVITKLVAWHGDELVKAYAEEFSIKYSVDRIVKEFYPRINKYNNTWLGKQANIVVNLMSFLKILERNIAQYSPAWQEKQLKAEIEKSDPLSFFLETKDSNQPGSRSQEVRRAVDSSRYEELARYASKNTIEKALAVYGIEFYTRVCFREYRFVHIKKLIEEGRIANDDDLRVVKRMLQKTRENADRDLNLQQYARIINELEKSINEKLKKG